MQPRNPMRTVVKKLLLCLAVLGSAMLFMGSSFVPDSPPPSRFIWRLIWTQDGEHLIFSTPHHGVHVVDTAGKRLRSIPQNTPFGNVWNPGNSAPALSPDGSRVVYVTYDKFDPAGNLTLETIGNFGFTPLSFLSSKTMTSLLISVFHLPEFRAAIEIASVEDSSVRRLTAYKDLDGDGEVDMHTEVDPVWSPDGTLIAFKSDQSTFSSESELSDSGLRLSIMNVDGSNVRVLAPSVILEWKPIDRQPSGSRFPVWSHDGKWIAFVGREEHETWRRTPGAPQVLYTVSPAGSGLTRIAETNSFGLLAWSPDSSMLAFVSPESNGKGGSKEVLFTVRPNGTGLTRVSEVQLPNRRLGLRLLRRSAIDTQEIWSPDGEWLAFARADEEGIGVYVVRPDGTDERLVVRDYGGPVSWSLDGSELYVAAMRFAVKVDGTSLRRFLSDEVADWDREILTAWSPDGSKLAVLSILENYEYDPTLTIVQRDGSHSDVLVQGSYERFIAVNSGWRESPSNTAACTQGYVVPEPEANPGLVADCETLLRLRDDLIGDSYVNWSTHKPIVTWDGVDIGCPTPLSATGVTTWQEITLECPSQPRVIGLWLGGMMGSIPPKLGELSGLKRLRLANGQLTGGIPPELGNLVNLEELRLNSTLFDGEIPPELGKLSNLKVLSLSMNLLTGGIPPELGNLAKLEELRLVFNFLGGGIPSELSNLSRLRVLQLDLTGLSGDIPPEIWELSRLEELSLAGNDLSGNIPPELENLASLRTLNISKNSLSGIIPRELGSLVNLEELYLAENLFNGAIPSEIGQLTQLQTLSIAGNMIDGTVPLELASLTSIWGLDISGNSLTGCIPAALSSRLTELYSDDIGYCD